MSKSLVQQQIELEQKSLNDAVRAYHKARRITWAAPKFYS